MSLARLPLVRPLSRSLIALTFASLSLGAVACDEKEEPKVEEKAPEPEPEPEPLPKVAPRLQVDNMGPLVGYERAVIEDEKGNPKAQGLTQLTEDLESNKEFFAGKEVQLTVDRKAKLEWVGVYLEKLAAIGPSKIMITTETRGDLPANVEFVAASTLDAPKSCTVVGIITQERGTAIWRIGGGTARKRGRGMGGPDLTMTGDTILSLAKKCESEVFVVSGAEGVDWGQVYDLAASAMIIEKAGLTKVSLPSKRPTAGRKVSLGGE